ncbi:MAG: hypothetical protein ACRD82_20055, partial [Blastocatellia bacterium]
SVPMLKSLFDTLRQAVMLTETLQRNQATLKELQKEVRELAQAMDERHRRNESAIERLAYEIQRLRDEFRHSAQHESDEREKFQLKIENQMLKAKFSLPPASEEKRDDKKGEQK